MFFFVWWHFYNILKVCMWVVKKIFQFLSIHFISVCLSIPSQATKVIMQRVISCFCSAVSAVVSEVAFLHLKYVAIRSWWPVNEWWPAEYRQKSSFLSKKVCKIALTALFQRRSFTGGWVWWGCCRDKVAAEHDTAVATTSQHHTTADYCDNSQFYTENELCQASLYEDSPLLEYHNTFEGSIPGILWNDDI